MAKGHFTGLKITSSPDFSDEVIDMSGVKILKNILGHIRYLEDEIERLREQNNFLEDEKSRCYLDMKKDEEAIERLKRSNLYLTQLVIDLHHRSERFRQDRRRQGRKWCAR
ncbi:hypothetical protein ABQH43_01555 [Streptococcus sp. ZJ100]|uniref:hypothetical protein n=1 Tax=Streptococcus handemini TaxID=3161188 RepID=UPI0032EE7198